MGWKQGSLPMKGWYKQIFQREPSVITVWKITNQFRNWCFLKILSAQLGKLRLGFREVN